MLPASAAATPQRALALLILAMAACLIWRLWSRRTAFLHGTAHQHANGPEDKPIGAHDAHQAALQHSKATGSGVDALALLRAAATGLAQVAWALPFAALLAFAAIWCAGDGIELKDANLLHTFSNAMVAFGLIALARRPFIAWTSKLSVRALACLSVPRDVLALIAASVCSVIALELPYNTTFQELPLQWVAIEFALALAILTVLYGVFQRFGAGPILGVIVFAGYGIAQHFVVQFKGAPILPSDLLALGTAAEVSSGYAYPLTDELLPALIATAGAICLLMFVRPGRHRGWKAHAINIGVNLCLAAACLGGLSGWYAQVDFAEELGFTYDYWWPFGMYTQQGSLPSFAAVLKDLPIDQPEDYSDEHADEVQASLAAAYAAGRGASPERAAAVEQFNQMKPTVIAIMNETFSDLSVYDNLRAGYTGPALYNSLPDALARGSLAVSVCGGGTANSEFEFLTGESLAFVGGGKYPYTLYNFEHVNSLVKQFSDLGYATTAMHPNAPNNWNRATVYRQLGFDDFLSIDDFEGAATFHTGVSDRATYDKILERLAASDEPQFIFDVTMQNHGGYDAWNIPPEQIPAYAPEGVTDEDLISQLNVYLSCIDASDRDLASFLDQLRTLGRPVVVIFFGDHQPSFASTLNDTFFPSEDETVHSERTLQTTYAIWANYDIAGADQTSARADSSASALAAQALDAIGAPLTDEQQAQLAARDTVPQLNIGGYRDQTGTWYALDTESPHRSLVQDLSHITYLNFARAVE